MSTDSTLLRAASQDYKLSFDLWEARNFMLSDVSSTGADDDALHTYPPSPDPLVAAPIVTAFDGVTQIGPVRGSISTGMFECDLLFPGGVAANFADYFGADLMIQTWHGNVPGVIGAAGSDPGRVRVFRGYMRAGSARRAWQDDQVIFTIRSSSSFLQDASFSRGIDWASGLAHSGPVAVQDAIDHLITQHTNLKPRSIVGYYIPNPTLDRLSVNSGSVYSMIKAIADSVAVESWVYCDREDNLQIRCHPTILPETWASALANPIIELTDDLIMGAWELTERPPNQIASVTLVGTASDGTEISTTYYVDGGVGSRPTYTGLRYESVADLDALAPRLALHLNRRYSLVANLPINVAIDLADIVTVTADFPDRGVSFNQDLFVATAITYQPVQDEQGRSFSGSVTLDQVYP